VPVSDQGRKGVQRTSRPSSTARGLPSRSPPRSPARVEFGDWQTPPGLAHEVLKVVRRRLRRAHGILEPTCGQGAFLVAATRAFPTATALGFDVSPAHVASARELLGDSATIDVADFFELQWERVLERLADPLLIIGNPPWVTNSALGSLDAGNLPPKTNFKRHAGLDARTGKSNFDISEWMLIRLLELVRARRFTMAMLCKASVARRLMQHVAAAGWSVTGEVRAIDARAHFSAAVDAVLLHVWSGRTRSRVGVRWPVYASLLDSAPARIMGVIEGRLLSDVDAYETSRTLEGESEIEWRSGIKHDCANVMELVEAGRRWRNGLGEIVELERSHVYPLLKGSDIANGRLEPRHHVIVTQRGLGQDTRALRTSAPLLWKYLHDHRDQLDGRKSSIYAKQPPFSIFGIGGYSFAPYKVAICGLYKRLVFSVIRPHDGQPVMVDDTAYFLPFEDEEAAEAAALALGSARAQAFFQARVFWDAKRPINKMVLQSLSLEALLRANDA
jgi:hypothetical protein